ncbi:MAG: DNA polymerase I [Pedosphaera sp.]|nr:DNA polymerase I [Pedosphaera sp.]
MDKKLFLLDGMALVYRAHFAFIARPIVTSKGVNTSALFGFTQTLLDIIKTQQPSHLAVVFDTEAPTQRHKDFPDYKAHRQAMPEELRDALPHVRRMIEAFNIQVITCDGWEADDVIGTLAKRAEREDFVSFLVTPDKDFGQLVSEKVFILKPSRLGDPPEILGVPEVLKKWSIERPAQVIDLLGLMGDASDNIPGVPGIGEKTASKLIAQFGSMENLLARSNEVKGKLRETIEANREQALLSRRLATIDCETPVTISLDELLLRPPNDEKVRDLCVEFEFNSIGRRLFGDAFKSGRGVQPSVSDSAPVVAKDNPTEMLLGLDEPPSPDQPLDRSQLKTIADTAHEYVVASDEESRRKLIQTLAAQKRFALAIAADGTNHTSARLLGLAFSMEAHKGFFVPLPEDLLQSREILEEFRSVLEADGIDIIGYDLKFTIAMLLGRCIRVRGRLFDVMVAHSLVEPELRHTLEYVSEVCLGYTPLTPAKLTGDEKATASSLATLPVEKLADFAVERADVAGQIWPHVGPLLARKGQDRVFCEIESPLIPVLADMEMTGIKVDGKSLADIGAQLEKEIAVLERTVCRLAGQEFNLNSTRQLGVILFEELKLAEKPKKTKTGLYATDEQTLLALAGDHEIIQRLLEYRELSKLKSTYVDALPLTISPRTGRIHTTYHQTATATGRLNSQDPNLQNIPIRTEQGKEVRRAFVSRDDEHVLLSADYSQIELRIIAALSHEAGLLEAFRTGGDVHTATASVVFDVPIEVVTPEMRRKAKMVNYGIAYGMSAFGLAQRLGIPRKESAAIIDQYFAQFGGVRRYMAETVAFAQTHGYVETVTGRRRYLRDIRSANATIRSAAERNAINAPIQGTAADMIKIAMVNIHRELISRRLRTRMLLQVHDELVFDLHLGEEAEVRSLVEDRMKNAITLEVPIVVEMGTGRNWLEAH